MTCRLCGCKQLIEADPIVVQVTAVATGGSAEITRDVRRCVGCGALNPLPLEPRPQLTLIQGGKA